MTDNTEFRPATFTYTEREVERLSFGVTDHKGRVIGAQVERFMVEITPRTEDESFGLASKRFGSFFGLSYDATRDGRVYGAGSAGYKKFDTAEEREAYVAKYLKGAAKRAEKTAAKGAR